MTLLLAALIMIPGSALATSYEEGRLAFDNKDYDTALQILEPLAVRGNVDAQQTLSIMYDFGFGVKKDPVQALNWYEKAALQGRPSLQHDLGVRYFRGDGIPQNYDKARLWWERAAIAGVMDSQYNLGLMYSQGLGVERDYDQAIVWYSEAADQGHADAQYNLGIIYAFGRGVLLDYEIALEYFSKAAMLGVAEAQYNLGIMHENGRGTPIDLPEARQWYEKAAKQGLKQAQNRLEKLEELPNPEAKNITAGNARVTPSAQERLLLELQAELKQEREKSVALTAEVHSKLEKIEQISKSAAELSAALQAAELQIAVLEEQLAAKSSKRKNKHKKEEPAIAEPTQPNPANQEVERLAKELEDKSELIERLIAQNQASASRQSELERQAALLSTNLNSAEAVIDNLNAELGNEEVALPIANFSAEAKMQAYNEVSVSGKTLDETENRIFTEINLEEWITSQDPNSYSLQLIALPGMQFVDKFFALYPLYNAEKAYFKSRKDGRDVYNIIYGVYPDIASARQEIRRLPAELRKKNPSVRKFETIQEYISQRGS